jgi:hypothetical protein
MTIDGTGSYPALVVCNRTAHTRLFESILSLLLAGSSSIRQALDFDRSHSAFRKAFRLGLRGAVADRVGACWLGPASCCELPTVQEVEPLFLVLAPRALPARMSPKVPILGFPLSITLIQESSERAMKEILISTTLATECLSRNRLQAQRGFW